MRNRTVRSLSWMLFAVFATLVLFVPSSMATSPVQQAVCDAETAACGKCGDGYCNKRCGETATSCPKDCAVSSESVQLACGRCGDGVCVKQCGENERSCPRDCAVKVQDDVLAALRDD